MNITAIRGIMSPLMSSMRLRLREFIRITSYRALYLTNRVKIRGDRNAVRHSSSALIKTSTIHINGNNNQVIVGDNSSLESVSVVINGSGHCLQIGAGCTIRGCAFVLEDDNCTISIGDMTSVEHHSHIAAVEPHSTVTIGNDCMLSSWVDIRTTDSHSIIDQKTQTRINFARDIVIGDHVWIGMQVLILKGVRIGRDSVVAARSICTKHAPEGTLIGGAPAHEIKNNISWKRERIGSKEKTSSN